MTKLNACAQCGSANAVLMSTQPKGGYPGFWYVECDECGAQIGIQVSPKEAVRVWNACNPNKSKQKEETRAKEVAEDEEGGFKKYDQGKPQLSLIPYEVLVAIAKVMEFGAKKYGRDNWKECKKPERYVDAAMRHLHQYTEEKQDSESGYCHLWHAACNLAFLIYLNSKREGERI